MTVYFLETGLVLLAAPWTVVWERNAFLDAVPSPSWRSFARQGAVRGAVSGLGLLSLGVGLWELVFIHGPAAERRRRAEAETPSPAAPMGERALAEEPGSWLRKS